jgi:homoserine O-acetyltransferase
VTAPSRFQPRELFITEAGLPLPGLELAYRSWGRLSAAADNAVVVCAPMSGSSDVEDWWPSLIGAGHALDPERDFVLGVDLVGSSVGSTGPASAAPDGAAWGRRFPHVSVRDQVRAQQRVLDHLGVRAVRLVLGGSLGGMLALEWALLDPRVRAAVVIAAGARQEAWAIGWNEAQRRALAADPAWAGEPFKAHAGLAAARAIGTLSRRAPQSLDERFARRPGERTPFAVSDWLVHEGNSPARRLDPLSYATLLDTMDSHDVGAGRGGVARVLLGLHLPLLAVAIDSDQLYPVAEVGAVARAAPHGELEQLRSPHGHDAFLADERVVESIVRRFRERLLRHERDAARPSVPAVLRAEAAGAEAGTLRRAAGGAA